MKLALGSIVVLSAIFSLAGCGGSGSQAEPEDHPRRSPSAKLDLHPEGGSGVSGTATFKDIEERVLVKLEVRNLPKPNTLYLAHIHPGTCDEVEQAHEPGQELDAEEAYGHEHGGASHEHEAGGHEHSGASHQQDGAEIEYPLSQVKSDSEGRGSSTTTLHDTSLKKLFSGDLKEVNVHEAGSGNPPVLSCAVLP